MRASAWMRTLPVATVKSGPSRQSGGGARLSRISVMLVRATAVTVAAWFGHAEAETLKLRYGQAYSSAHSIFSLPVAVAEREGLFVREGLDVRVIVPIPGGSDKMIAALHDDWVDVTHVATPFLVRAALAGSDAVAIAAEFKNPI